MGIFDRKYPGCFCSISNVSLSVQPFDYILVFTYIKESRKLFSEDYPKSS